MKWRTAINRRHLARPSAEVVARSGDRSERKAKRAHRRMVVPQPSIPVTSSRTAAPVKGDSNAAAPASAAIVEAASQSGECGRNCTALTSVLYTDGNAAVPQFLVLILRPECERTNGSGL